jgi:hypothetical protein
LKNKQSKKVVETGSACQLALLFDFLTYVSTLKMEAMCSPKLQAVSKLHGCATEKAVLFIFTAVKTSNSIKYELFYVLNFFLLFYTVKVYTDGAVPTTFFQVYQHFLFPAACIILLLNETINFHLFQISSAVPSGFSLVFFKRFKR